MGFVVPWARMWYINEIQEQMIKSYVHFGKVYVEKLRIRCTKRNLDLGKCYKTLRCVINGGQRI